jgi:hypothetical protein
MPSDRGRRRRVGEPPGHDPEVAGAAAHAHRSSLIAQGLQVAPDLGLQPKLKERAQDRVHRDLARWAMRRGPFSPPASSQLTTSSALCSTTSLEGRRSICPGSCAQPQAPSRVLRCTASWGLSLWPVTRSASTSLSDGCALCTSCVAVHRPGGSVLTEDGYGPEQTGEPAPLRAPLADAAAHILPTTHRALDLAVVIRTLRDLNAGAVRLGQGIVDERCITLATGRVDGHSTF